MTEHIYAMIRVEHTNPKMVETLSALLGVTPTYEPCHDCGEMCLRTEEPVAVTGIAHPEQGIAFGPRDEERIRVCTACCAERAFASGDWEAGTRYRAALAVFEEAKARGFE